MLSVIRQSRTTSRSTRAHPARAGATRVLELYSGAGLLTLPLAALGCEIHSLEADEQAVRDARRTLHDFGAARLHVGRAGVDSVASLGSGFGPDALSRRRLSFHSLSLSVRGCR